MSELQALATIRAQTLALMQELTAQPKPSYEVDGQQVAWSDYLARLAAIVEWCDRQMADQGPFEVATLAET